jgi:hypothetical protein
MGWRSFSHRTSGCAEGAGSRGLFAGAPWPNLSCAVLLAVSCEASREAAGDAPPPPEPQSTEQALSVAPPAPPEPPAGSVREVHPKGGRSSCLEMYSSCTTVDGQLSCTSAPFSLECGEEAALPSTRERLRCICP